MKRYICLGMVFLLPAFVFAQSPEDIQRKAMEEFAWLLGEWEGTSVVRMGPGEPETVLMTERLELKLDGTIIQVTGIGREKTESGEPGEIVHDAIAVISYDVQAQKYRWNAWRVPYGVYTQYEPVLTENGFTWSMETPQGKMRYDISKTPEGNWREIGEFSRDGENWVKFMEMNLTKKK